MTLTRTELIRRIQEGIHDYEMKTGVDLNTETLIEVIADAIEKADCGVESKSSPIRGDAFDLSAPRPVPHTAETDC